MGQNTLKISVFKLFPCLFGTTKFLTRLNTKTQLNLWCCIENSWHPQYKSACIQWHQSIVWVASQRLYWVLYMRLSNGRGLPKFFSWWRRGDKINDSIAWSSTTVGATEKQGVYLKLKKEKYKVGKWFLVCQKFLYHCFVCAYLLRFPFCTHWDNDWLPVLGSTFGLFLRQPCHVEGAMH